MSLPTLRRRTISRDLATQHRPERHEDFSTDQVTLSNSRRRPTVTKAIVILLLTLPIIYLLRQSFNIVLRPPIVLMWDITHSLVSSLAEMLHALAHQLHSFFCAKRDELHSVCRHFSEGTHDHAREAVLLSAMLVFVLIVVIMLVRTWQCKSGDEESCNWMKATTSKIWWQSQKRKGRKKMK